MDIALLFRDNDLIDFEIASGDLQKTRDLETAVIMSLFTNRRASQDDPLPHDAESLMGWWGDSYATKKGDRIGSRLWLLSREKQTNETLTRACEYVKEALQWMLDDRVVTLLETNVEWVRMGVLGIEVKIYRPGSGEIAGYQFDYAWEQFAA